MPIKKNKKTKKNEKNCFKTKQLKINVKLKRKTWCDISFFLNFSNKIFVIEINTSKSFLRKHQHYIRPSPKKMNRRSDPRKKHFKMLVFLSQNVFFFFFGLLLKTLWTLFMSTPMS